MSFEIVPLMIRKGSIETGYAGYSACNQRFKFCVSDLRRIGVTAYVLMLIDKQTLRIAFRAPRDGETGAKLGKVNKAGCCEVAAVSAIKMLGLDTKRIAGNRFKLMEKEDMLIVQLEALAKAK